MPNTNDNIFENFLNKSLFAYISLQQSIEYVGDFWVTLYSKLIFNNIIDQI